MREDIASTVDSVLNYDYHGMRSDLVALYEKAKQNQWNASTDIDGLREAVLRSPIRKVFRKELFSTLVPNLRQVGLLPERLRSDYAALGVLEYEHLPASA